MERHQPALARPSLGSGGAAQYTPNYKLEAMHWRLLAEVAQNLLFVCFMCIPSFLIDEGKTHDPSVCLPIYVEIPVLGIPFDTLQLSWLEQSLKHCEKSFFSFSSFSIHSLFFSVEGLPLYYWVHGSNPSKGPLMEAPSLKYIVWKWNLICILATRRQ